MLQINKISDSELEVIKVLWESQCSMSAIEITEKLNKNMGWENSTVRTLIRRLNQKGFLVQEKKENTQMGRKKVFYYLSAVSQEEYMKETTREFVKKTYRGNAKNLVASLFQNKLLSKDDIKELKSFWEQEGD
ncbi:BlaI/MecI/CopY family transcriptional regulator [Vallitalea okinawensis]|uniref:BlaI/MecI/CopY family transcriptional regulator n=1 Tax=Vallitalea okinawensis TaxID=2078660 RepID=UPI001300A51E|nr:BlaI/MecI/CopY family transcriptional regulator [Vallitalea okinawensis]